MRILLTGKNGQVGFELRRSLSVLGDVYALGTADCDLRDEAAVRRVVRGYRPDVIVNPAAYTAVDQAEKDLLTATAVNARAVAVLAEEAQLLNALLVHFSTDYVFDGTKVGSYTEDDLPNPTSVYGATKLAGERAAQSVCTRHVILRTSWVAGAHGSNFLKTMLRLAEERETLNVVADQFGAPTCAALLADVTAHLVRQASTAPEEFPFGVYHTVAAGVASWHEYASYVIERARALGKPIKVAPEAIRAVGAAEFATLAKRPMNSRLDTRKLRETFGLHLPRWQDGVDQLLLQIL